MKTLVLFGFVLAAFLLSAATGETFETGLEDQTDVAVTAYNNGLGLVKDQRTVSLSEGRLALHFKDVAQKIKPETVSLRSLSSPGSIQVLEQNYEYDLISPDKIMEKYVGEQVKLVNFSKEIGFTTQDAVLLSVNGGPIYKVGEEIYLGHPGTVVLPRIPENLIAQPSLIWELENQTGQTQTIEATYLTNGFTWQADYVLTVNQEEKAMDLAAWVTLDNQSGATYNNARLKLVAGEVHVAEQPAPPRGRDKLAMAGEAMAMAEEAFAEYHLYTLPRRTAIKQNQSKQLSMLTASGVPIAKEYEFRGHVRYYFGPLPPVKEQNIEVYLTFRNDEQNSLGVPLPAGVMRVYQPDSEGILQFAGEDRIDHTPKDEDVRLKLGTAFDIVGERKQTEFQRIADNVYESAFEIALRNHKKTAISVDVVEPMVGDWTLLDASHEYEKRDAQTAVFSVKVSADGETIVTYRVRVKT
jgi:hypothetical protein